MTVTVSLYLNRSVELSTLQSLLKVIELWDPNAVVKESNAAHGWLTINVRDVEAEQ